MSPGRVSFGDEGEGERGGGGGGGGGAFSVEYRIFIVYE